MTFPTLCLHLDPVKEAVGWAAGVGSRLQSGYYDFNARGVQKPGLRLPKLGAWLGDLRLQQPLLGAVGVIDLEPLTELAADLQRYVRDWAMSTAGHLQFVTTGQIKRLATGPYATQRDVIEWARATYRGQSINFYEQAAAIAGLVHMARSDSREPLP